MRFTAIPLLFLGLLPSLLTAQESQASQASQDSDNPLTVPACSTMLSIVLSCESKLGDAASVSGSVFSCLCFDNSGKYKPTVYDNAVAGCSSKYSDQSTDFDFWLPGFCTGSSYATDTGAAASTTGGGSAIGLTGVPTVATNTGVNNGCLSEYDLLLIRIDTLRAFFKPDSKSGRLDKFYDLEPYIDYSCSN